MKLTIFLRNFFCQYFISNRQNLSRNDMDDGFDGDYLDLNVDRVPLYNGMHDGGQGTNATYRGENN